ncbi:MAG: TRAP transporter small permease, partial [Pseudorhodoplanes sp.]
MKRIGTIASTISGAVAAEFLVGMQLLTVADVVLRAFFNYPIRGVYELVELMLAGTFFIALPCVFLR